MATPQITWLETFDISLGALQAILGTTLTACAAPFRSSNTAKTLKRHLLLDITRRGLQRLSTHQLQYLFGTTETNYYPWTKQQKIPARSVQLPSIDTKAFWFGEPDAENIVIYYHGGGWAMPGAEGHFEFISSLVSQSKSAGKPISVLFLGYDLAPGGQYPRQLIQAVEILRYCVTTLGKSPAKIMLLGDSAGGNLVLSVLSHLLHPHPEIAPLELAAPLRGAMSSSPVCVLSTENPRFITQEAQDPAGKATISNWLKNYLGSRAPDAYSSPLSNDPSWWSGLEKVVKEVLITAASVEMMAEDTIACADIIKQAHSGADIFVSEVDFHAQCTIGPSLGLELGEAAQVMISWAMERY